MEVTLSPELERLVQEHVAQGGYRNASALIDEAVHLLLDSDRAESELEVLVREGIGQRPAEEISQNRWTQLRDKVHAIHAARKGE